MTLKLKDTGITKDGVANLVKGNFPYLQSLTLSKINKNIDDNRIDDDVCMKSL